MTEDRIAQIAASVALQVDHRIKTIAVEAIGIADELHDADWTGGKLQERIDALASELRALGVDCD